MGLSNPSREIKFSGANGDREIFIFLVQLTTSRIGHLTRLIHALAIRVTIYIIYTHLQKLLVTLLILCPSCELTNPNQA